MSHRGFRYRFGMDRKPQPIAQCELHKQVTMTCWLGRDRVQIGKDVKFGIEWYTRPSNATAKVKVGNTVAVFDLGGIDLVRTFNL